MREKGRRDEAFVLSVEGMWPASEYFNVPAGLSKASFTKFIVRSENMLLRDREIILRPRKIL